MSSTPKNKYQARALLNDTKWLETALAGDSQYIYELLEDAQFTRSEMEIWASKYNYKLNEERLSKLCVTASTPILFKFDGYYLNVGTNYKWENNKQICIVTPDYCVKGDIIHQETLNGNLMQVIVNDRTDPNCKDLPQTSYPILNKVVYTWKELKLL